MFVGAVWSARLAKPEIIVQALPQSAPSPIPQKPTCIVWYAGDACDDLLQQYHQALLVHQQQEWETSVAVPLRKQIADQQRRIAEQQDQIKTLQVTIEAQSTASLYNQARSRAAIELLGSLLGIGMALLVALAAFRRLVRNSNFAMYEEHRPESA